MRAMRITVDRLVLNIALCFAAVGLCATWFITAAGQAGAAGSLKSEAESRAFLSSNAERIAQAKGVLAEAKARRLTAPALGQVASAICSKRSDARLTAFVVSRDGREAVLDGEFRADAVRELVNVVGSSPGTQIRLFDLSAQDGRVEPYRVHLAVVGLKGSGD